MLGRFRARETAAPAPSTYSVPLALAPAPTADEAREPARVGTAVGVVMVVIGVFGPWIKTLGWNVSVNGVASADAAGWLFLVGAALALMALYRHSTARSRRAITWVTVLGALGVVGAVVEVVRFQRDINQAHRGAQQFVHLSLGWGLYVVVIGAVAATACSVLVRRADLEAA